MPLTSSEIVPGAVAYFDQAALAADDRVKKAQSPLPAKSHRPFLCVVVAGDTSAWVPLTHDAGEKGERIAIGTEWRSGGSPKWRTDGQYLDDGSATFVGPNAAFVAAAANEEPQKLGRPMVAPPGVQVVAKEVSRRGGRLP